jgi:outer membrane protein insertion porin family/translocation and assembly module TamA
MIRSRFRVAALCLLLVGTVACKEEGGVKVASFKFTGNKAVTTTQLKSVLATAASSKLPWGTKRYFSREQFEADLKRIVAFYNDRGYPDARVASFDAHLSDDQSSVNVTVNISEGEPVKAERIVLEGFESLPEQHRRTLDTRLPLKVGAPVDRALVQASREAALDELRDHGHPYASVRLSEAEGSTPKQRVITMRADAGPIARYGEIQISGNATVSENVIRRQLTFRPGGLFRQSRLTESQRKLYGLELFEFANIEAVGTESKPESIPVRVTVTKSKHKKVNFGVGYGSEEKARAEIDWRHVNAFSGAETVGVHGRYSSLDRGVRLTYKQPYLFSPRWSVNVNGQLWHTDEPAFNLDTTGGRVTATRQFARGGGPVLGRRPSMALSFTYANEHESSTIANDYLADLTFRDDLIALGLDPTKGESSGQRSAISVDANRNTTDNLLDAKRGYVATLHLEQAGRILGGTYDYWEATTEARAYQKIGRAAVLAFQARAGSITASGDESSAVPFHKRYFLGGATTLRGWGRYEVSPLSGAGLPIGGTKFANASAELRAPLFGSLSGVIFIDGGRVWGQPTPEFANDSRWRYDAGPGLRYQTPVGPLRIDLGYQLNRIPGLLVNGKAEPRRFRFHFSIGQAF